MSGQETGRWLVTGASGMLGTELVRRLLAIGADVLAADHATLDITDPAAVRRALIQHQPHVVVNCAAYTQVDAAEHDPDEAMRINGEGPQVLASACATDGGRLLQISTDYVFSGSGERPYDEDDPQAPVTAYGRSKLAGERAVLETLPRHGIVVRTAWLYSVYGKNFVRTILRLESERERLQVVDDQYGQPTWARDVAARLVALGSHHAAAGVFHATAAGETTWYEFAREIFRQKGTDPDRVQPITSQAAQRAAPRPAYSVLGHRRWTEVGIDPLPDWRESLAQAFSPSAQHADGTERSAGARHADGAERSAGARPADVTGDAEAEGADDADDAKEADEVRSARLPGSSASPASSEASDYQRGSQSA